ncbi:MAG: large-conductance mechanosensitive channel protein MscL [Muribaculaceae bacterium]|nr:large-conductance mechanosensitive channel protein MscL [Muribaculaceae bacterium]
MKCKFLSDFKDFAVKGNVIDMAVGVIIGGAFGKIVTSLVNDVIMPAIGVAIGGLDFKNLKWVMKDAVMDGETVVSPEVAMNYGNFIQNVVDFIIIAFCIFVMIKLIMNLKRKKEEPVQEPAPAPEPEPTKEELLLTEIRDLLKENNAKK